MALKAEIKEMKFGVGDSIRVVQRIKEGDKSREAYFEGMVIKIKGRAPGKTFTVRKIAEGGIGVERIFPFALPSLDRIVVVKEGTRGVRRAKLYFTRRKSPTEVGLIHKKAATRKAFKEKKQTPAKKAPRKVKKAAKSKKK